METYICGILLVMLVPSWCVLLGAQGDVWSTWINRMHPNSVGEFEHMTPNELKAFCPNSKVNKVECETTDGIAYYSSGEILQCTTTNGLVCNNADNFPIPCSDYKIRYHCVRPGLVVG